MACGPCDRLQEGVDVTNTEWLKTLLITKESEGALYYEEARSIRRANFRICSQTRFKPEPKADDRGLGVSEGHNRRHQI